jgi:predicted PurR-regulated permease PerM
MKTKSSGMDRFEVELVPAFGFVALVTFLSGPMLSYFRVFWPDFYVAAILIGIHPIVDWVIHVLPRSILLYCTSLYHFAMRARAFIWARLSQQTTSVDHEKKS